MGAQLRIGRVAMALLVAAVAACGGGGGAGGGAGGTSGALAVTIETPAIVTSLLADGQSGAPLTGEVVAEVVGHYSGTASAVYALISPTGSAFFVGQAFITLLPGNRFSVQLRVNTLLNPGTHTGSLAVRVCGDPSCASQYTVTPSSVPYTVTVLPPITIGVAVDGVPQPMAGLGPLSLNDGDVLSLTASEPVVWTPALRGVDAIVTTDTATQWTATVTARDLRALTTSTVRALRSAAPAGGPTFTFNVGP
jgi:hypothetical protein